MIDDDDEELAEIIENFDKIVNKMINTNDRDV